MLRLLCAWAVAATLTGLSGLLLIARYPSAGPVVLHLTAEHGVHLGDLAVVTTWALAMLALGCLVSQSAARRSHRSPGNGPGGT